jgi:hypothetical protein
VQPFQEAERQAHHSQMKQCETAAYLATNRILILVLIDNGILPAARDDESLKINRSDLDRLIVMGLLPRPDWSN